MAPGHQPLVELIGGGIEDRECERPGPRSAPAGRPRQGSPRQQRQDPEHPHVPELAHDEVEPRVRHEAQVRLRREDEDQRRPGDDRDPAGEERAESGNSARRALVHHRQDTGVSRATAESGNC